MFSADEGKGTAELKPCDSPGFALARKFWQLTGAALGSRFGGAVWLATVSAFVLGSGLLWKTPAELAAPVSYELDGFENGIRVVQPNTGDANKYLWNLYNGSGSGPTSVTTAQKYAGNQSLRSQYDSGNNWQFQFYTYTEGVAGFNNGWQFMRKFVTNPTSWQTGKVNRMRFWMLLPPGTDEAGGGNHNFEFGTYIRCSACGGAEDGGGHYYHHFDLPYTGVWHQLIVDTHPNHLRGNSGGTELGDLPNPTNEPGFTYFDLMTRFYLDFPYDKFPMPAVFYMDNFEVYEEQRPENTEQVYSLNAVYVPSTNMVRVGWARRKDQDTVKHDVRYAFSDIHSIGWAAATPAPNGTVTPPGTSGYNGMEWSTTGLNLSGKSVVYVAIKPQNSSLFRQIAVPVVPGATLPTPPAAPFNVRVIR
jgi:hypothetical protein